MNGCQNGHPEFSSGSVMTFETDPDSEVSGFFRFLKLQLEYYKIFVYLYT